MTKPYLIFKRMMDVAVAAVLLVVLSPIILLSLVVQWIEIGSNPIFFQERPGKNEKVFKIFKLKTMNEKRGVDGELLEDRVRITRLGAFFRSASIDELPQLINVLKGDMSFVGPRPLLAEYLPLYNEKQRLRHSIRPGITGLAQVNGRNAISWQEKFDLDAQYVRTLSFLVDMNILFKTVVKVIRRSDIQSNSVLTMEKFKGNH